MGQLDVDEEVRDESELVSYSVKVFSFRQSVGDLHKYVGIEINPLRGLPD